jgi:hypothetical protein
LVFFAEETLIAPPPVLPSWAALNNAAQLSGRSLPQKMSSGSVIRVMIAPLFASETSEKASLGDYVEPVSM